MPGRRRPRGPAELLLRRRAADRRAAARSGPTSTPTRPTRWPTRRRPGPELWAQTAGRITHFVAGAGTCGTITGVARYLKAQNPAIRIIAADPEGSVFSGGSGRPYLVEGVGEDFFPAAWDRDLYDDVIADQRRGELPHRPPGLARSRASSSAAPAAWPSPPRSRSPSGPAPDDIVVVLNPDSGRGYLSRVFDDEWMANFGFLRECDECVGAVLDTRARHRPSCSTSTPTRPCARPSS